MQGSVFVIVVFALEVDNIFECLDFLSGLTFFAVIGQAGRGKPAESRV